MAGKTQRAGSTVDAVARAIAPGCGRVTGHPIVVDLSLKREIFELNANQGLREVVHAHPDRIRLVDVDSDAILIDCDLPEDYRRLSEQ